MKLKKYVLLIGTLGLLLTMVLPASAAPATPATRGNEALWADGVIWDTILTPATFKAPNNVKSVDALYVFMNLDGQRPIAEAAPYEWDYNGGRWHVMAVYFTDAGIAAHDPDGDGVANFELTNDDTLIFHMMNLGHFMIEPTDTYFVCPLVPA